MQIVWGKKWSFTCNFLNRSPCVLLFPCFPCFAFQNCFWAEYLFMGHTLKRQSGEEDKHSGTRESLSASQVKCHSRVLMWWNCIFRWMVIYPPEACRVTYRQQNVSRTTTLCHTMLCANYLVSLLLKKRSLCVFRCSFCNIEPVWLYSYTPLNFLGGLAKSPASGWTTHLSSTSLQRRATTWKQFNQHFS